MSLYTNIITIPPDCECRAVYLTGWLHRPRSPSSPEQLLTTSNTFIVCNSRRNSSKDIHQELPVLPYNTSNYQLCCKLPKSVKHSGHSSFWHLAAFSLLRGCFIPLSAVQPYLLPQYPWASLCPRSPSSLFFPSPHHLHSSHISTSTYIATYPSIHNNIHLPATLPTFQNTP